MNLDDIVFNKRQEVTALKLTFDLDQAQKAIAKLPKPHDLKKALTKKKLALIAEVKKASPSAGLICKEFSPVAIALEYQEAGAAAISVLTDEKYFQGKLDDLRKIRKKVSLPLLRKDFIVDEAQIYESRLAGADAILLIVRILTNEELKKFLALAAKLKMSALVEVHDLAETMRALEAGAEIIGINNRDLDALTINLQNSFYIIKSLPQLKKLVIVSESGIQSGDETARLSAVGVNAVLVGESLLTSKDIKAKARELIG
ncbi:MAG: indole-3-glycerol phosphate synthase TrpC [Candidatus Margulisbacteria bacterium]|nr:indole-3-glycerol phosphate synthase TrpC [Candidatus Margulisiibacteriota bacterium]MBU1616363.1 indole-3-glycerol phosphate synthase TrpC [Candidatus Margulisiibacteriota bacterium]MBU1867107.1 indole-3-glycerol phosphate synthase TrpC [Candidatus Margulisiibacteriota bacterium]